MSVVLSVGEARALASILEGVLTTDATLDATEYAACSAVLVELRVADRLGAAPRRVLVEVHQPDDTDAAPT